MKPTLYDTRYIQARFINKDLLNSIKFLTTYANMVMVDDSFLNDIKVYSTTPASTIFTNLKAAEKNKAFVFYQLNGVDDIPSLLTVADITIDGLFAPIDNVPKNLQKCWINLTPIISQKASYNDRINVVDTTELTNLMTRGALTMSYHSTKDLWLPPNLATYVIEFYSGVITNTLRQMYSLNYDEQMFVQTLFAAYYAQCLGGENQDLALPPLLMRCAFLGSGADIQNRMNSVLPDRENNGNSYMCPPVICTLLAKCGPPRMHNFDATKLYRFVSATATDSQIMLMALDFPPYWVYQMLRVAAGYKNPIMSNMIKLTGTKMKLQQFATELANSNIIIQKADR